MSTGSDRVARLVRAEQLREQMFVDHPFLSEKAMRVEVYIDARGLTTVKVRRKIQAQKGTGEGSVV